MAASSDEAKSGIINMQVATFVQTSINIEHFRQRRYAVMFDNGDSGGPDSACEAETEKLYSEVIPLKSADDRDYRVQFMAELTKDVSIFAGSEYDI